jgi:hypothetical protein
MKEPASKIIEGKNNVALLPVGVLHQREENISTLFSLSSIKERGNIEDP